MSKTSITSGQERQFRRMMDDIIQHATDLAVAKVEADVEGWQRVLEHGDELKAAVAKFVVAKTRELSVVSSKFALLVDLGEITVPDDYVHGTRLAIFYKQNRKKFYYYDDTINDANFPNPSRILKPGDKLRVRAFKQIVSGTTTSEERMAFLAAQAAVHTGAQGASLVFDQKRNQLPKGYWYASFDDKERLWEDACGHHRVSGVLAFSAGNFNFHLGDFEDVWDDSGAFLCFSDVPAEAGVE